MRECNSGCMEVVYNQAVSNSVSTVHSRTASSAILRCLHVDDGVLEEKPADVIVVVVVATVKVVVRWRSAVFIVFCDNS